MLASNLIIAGIILSIFMAIFLVLLQMTIVYGTVSPLSSNSSTCSGVVLKVVKCSTPLFLAPMATSGDNVYVTWLSNKTTEKFEIMFRASTDGGNTFGSKINLSNSTKVDSIGPSIGAEGRNVYVSWWEINDKDLTREPVFRASNDDGATFGPILKLASNGTIGSSKDDNE
jgi:hypothetical protein